MKTKKEYVNKAFQDRIEISLAEISKSPNDKFVVKYVTYVPSAFKCELCGHIPCIYEYGIENLQTKITINVGSECVKHFEDECDIDVANGLKNRMRKVIKNMRKELKNHISEEEFKNIDINKKREIYVKMFMVQQSKSILKNENNKRSVFTKDEVEKIIKEVI